jgi:hypothetical protein
VIPCFPSFAFSCHCNLVQFTAIPLGRFKAQMHVFKWNLELPTPGFQQKETRERRYETEKENRLRGSGAQFLFSSD